MYMYIHMILQVNAVHARRTPYVDELKEEEENHWVTLNPKP